MYKARASCQVSAVTFATVRVARSIYRLAFRNSFWIMYIYIIWCILLKMKKIRTNIYLSDRQKHALERLSKKTGAPVAELVRRAIDAYLLSQKKDLK